MALRYANYENDTDADEDSFLFAIFFTKLAAQSEAGWALCTLLPSGIDHFGCTTSGRDPENAKAIIMMKRDHAPRVTIKC